MKMLTAGLVVLLYLKLALAEGNYAPAPGYASDYAGEEYGYDYSDDILQEIRELLATVKGLNTNDQDISRRITDLVHADQLNSAFTRTVLDNIFPEIRDRQNAQNAEISNLEQQAEKLLQLTGDIHSVAGTIEEANNAINLLNDFIRQFRENITIMQNTDDTQNDRIADALSQLDYQDELLTDLNARSAVISERMALIHDTLAKIAEIYEFEQGFSTNLILTSDNPIASAQINGFQSGTPILHYGISALRVDDDPASKTYGGYSNSNMGYDNYDNKGYASKSYGYTPGANETTLAFEILARHDRASERITSTLFGFSEGRIVKEVQVSVALMGFDNSIIEFDVLDEKNYGY